ncbi:hypothetical protein A9Q87_04900 [Flavobacteriales bacterium 34_180_T64]|nr:hypothetical protein A9Q87_04900 [Flavobacteriales bacterium 34_180_T64]
MSKDTLALTYTGIIALCFLLAGIFDVLDYFIVQALLFIGFILFLFFLILQIIRDIEQKNHLD